MTAPQPTPPAAPHRPRSSRPLAQRRLARLLHLVAAGALGTFVYAPAEVAEPMRLALQVGVMPLAIVTGLVIWKQAVIRRLLTRRPGRRGPTPAAP